MDMGVEGGAGGVETLHVNIDSFLPRELHPSPYLPRQDATDSNGLQRISLTESLLQVFS